MQMSISLNNSTVLVLVNGKKFELTRTRTRNSNSTWLETRNYDILWMQKEKDELNENRPQSTTK